MELWDSVVLQARLWQTGMRLGATDPAARLQAIETLSQAGSAAIPCLRFHLLREMTLRGRAQFAAAVALQRLNVPEGMTTLLQALDRPLTAFTELAPQLEEAFLLVGSPAATDALQSVWPNLQDWHHGAPIPPDVSSRIQMICRVWAGLQDPSVLELLLAYATRIPELFPPTAAAFGQMAVRKLREATHSADPFERILVVRTLGRIPGEPSFRTLIPLLRDPEASVRLEACRALALIGTPQAVGDALANAIQAGYSTEESVHLLAAFGHPQLYDTLLRLIERASALYQSTHDTPGAALTALSLLLQAPWPTESLLRIVCTLLEKPHPTEIILAAIGHLVAFRGRCSGQDAHVQAVLWNLLADFSPKVRAQAAQALVIWGDPNGKRFLDLLAECRPQGSFLEKLTTLLRGGPDAAQAATQAMQQVQQWVTRLSREAVVRLASPTLSGDPARIHAPQDPRVPGLTRALLSGALRYLDSALALEETEEALALSITAMRALRRLEVADGLTAQPELRRALYTHKVLTTSVLSSGAPFQFSREIGEPVREEAALAFIEFLGAESFGVFVAALRAAHPEVQGTAILALGRLGDARAVPYLQPIAADPDGLLAAHAVQALAVIRQNNPEMMTLLRGSSLPDVQPHTLLRPLPFSRSDSAPELLLRPSTNGETTP